MRRSGDRSSYRTYYLKRLVWPVIAATAVFFLCIAGHAEDREFLVSETVTLEDACVNADSGQKKVIFRIVPEYMAGYTQSGERPGYGEIRERALLEPGIRTAETAGDVADIIVRKLAAYDADRFDLTDTAAVVISAVLAFFCPVLIMYVRRIVINERTADEIVQFQTIVNVMRKLPGILPISMLQAMEEFSVVYRRSLRECISSYNADPMKALERLYFSEKEDGFRMIIEDFMRVPEAGVEAAFEEVTGQIRNYGENRKQEQAHRTEKMTRYAMWLSLAPALLIIFGYMLAPFMISVGGMFDELTGTLTGAAAGG